MSKPVILTGLRANNDLHIGNYFGALLPLIDMAKNKSDDYQINLFMPDLHSFTTPIDHSQLQAQIQRNLRLFVAAGLPLNNDNIHIYRQSYVPAHSELTIILNSFTGFGEMGRMTQFKEKSGLQMSNKYDGMSNARKDSYDQNTANAADMRTTSEGHEGNFPDQMRHEADVLEIANDKSAGRISVGLFDYPVLMAADILLYGAQFVPVGDDQTQHLEFTRDIAERFNNKFGKVFSVPEPVRKQHEFFGKDQGLRIKDLQNPSRKMSKSEESAKGVIFLGDEPEVARKKIMSAETDSVGAIHYDIDQQPGISNLLQILALATGTDLSNVSDEFQGKTSYGALKEATANAVVQLLTDFQARLAEVDESRLTKKLEQDEAKMNETANETLAKVQKAVGLR